MGRVADDHPLPEGFGMRKRWKPWVAGIALPPFVLGVCVTLLYSMNSEAERMARLLRIGTP
jgi:hypothetical protein